MTLKEFLVATKTAIINGAKKIITALFNANMANIVKAGIFVGASALTVVAVLRYIKHKRHVYNNEENKSVVDRALQINFTDMRNIRELNPLMGSVKKRLMKDSKPRTTSKKKFKNKKGSWFNYLASISNDVDDEPTRRGPVALHELERFKMEMDAIERERRYRDDDGFSLRRCWINS